MLMHLRRVFLLLVCAIPLFADIDSPSKPRIVLVGDSTVTDTAGWGLGFKSWISSDAECINMAQGGRSSKSFIAEGHWARALALKGSYYLIQFGHNDQPGKGPERETDPQSTYLDYMSRYIDEARAIGATPILVTSLTRRTFDPEHPGAIRSTLTPYVAAVKMLANEKHVPLIDLHSRSIALCEELGPERTAQLDVVSNGKRDTTHLDAHGSQVFARLVVEELRKAAPALAHLLRDEPVPNGTEAVRGPREDATGLPVDGRSEK